MPCQSFKYYNFYVSYLSLAGTFRIGTHEHSIDRLGQRGEGAVTRKDSGSTN